MIVLVVGGELQIYAVKLAKVGNAPVENTFTRFSISHLHTAGFEPLKLLYDIFIADREQKKSLAVLGQVPSRHRFRVVRRHEHEPTLADARPCDLRTSRSMLDDFKWRYTKRLRKSRHGLFEITNDEVYVVNAGRLHTLVCARLAAQAAWLSPAGKPPAFGNSAGTPRPSSASSQRLIAMILSSDTPVATPDLSSM